MSLSTGTLYGVGVGPGDPELLTLKALNVLQSVDLIFEVTGRNSRTSVSGSILDAHKLKTERRLLTFSMSKDSRVRQQTVKDNADIVAEALRAGKDCAFATIGDPNVYSTFLYLCRDVQAVIPGLEVKTIPGITSFQAAAANTNLPLVEDTEKLLLIPAFEPDEIEHYQVGAADTLVFLKTYKTRDAIMRFLDKHNFSVVLYASHIGLDNEFISLAREEIDQRDDEYLSLIIAKRQCCRDNP